jgi:ABC-type lipoprotein export system ATPase subunit
MSSSKTQPHGAPAEVNPSEDGGHPPPFLRATGLCKRYQMGQRTVEVLKGIEIKVGRGEFVALRGASGTGKSTLLHLLGGLDVPDSGSLWVDGHEVTRFGASELARFRNRRVGFIFQAYHLLPDLTALENVLLPARLARMTPAKALDEAHMLLDRVGLSSRLKHRPSELSGGEQQRVAIARCLVNRPELILADEPTGNLDSRTGDEVLGLLLDLRADRGTTLIIATHDARVAARALRSVEVIDGRIQRDN